MSVRFMFCTELKSNLKTSQLQLQGFRKAAMKAKLSPSAIGMTVTFDMLLGTT